MKYYFFLLLSFIFLSCSKEIQYIEPKQNLRPVLDSFITKKKCNGCIHELYIDKVSPHIFNLVLYKGNKSLTQNENNLNGYLPLVKTHYDNIEVNIYSGVEHFFNVDTDCDVHDKNKYNGSESFSEIWFLKDSFNIITVEKKDFIYPFLTPPIENKLLIDLDSVKKN